MKTDMIFYQLFSTFHTLLFELIDRPITEAESYEFSSVEVKEKAFRFDGIFSPKAKDKPIYLIEVQFQQKEGFYWEYLSEIYLYLNQYRSSQEWQAMPSLRGAVMNQSQEDMCRKCLTARGYGGFT